jgi:predicted GIY-YIG superfamily endonuclease
MVKVYWIRHKNHTDIMTEGYVGISNNFENRLKFHKEKNKNKKLRNAMTKYGNDIVTDIVYEFHDKEEALRKEYELRPSEFIGWNLAPGGGMPPSINDYPDAIEKIRQSIKDLNMTPYCEETHSKESKGKRKKTIDKKCYRWYHNPETLEYKLIATSEDQIPEGWQPGRKPKVKQKKRIRGIDYECNSKTWEITDPDGNKYIVTNLKRWCKERDLPYFGAIRSGKWKGWFFNKA